LQEVILTLFFLSNSDLNNKMLFKIFSLIICGHSTKIEYSPNFLYFKL